MTDQTESDGQALQRAVEVALWVEKVTGGVGDDYDSTGTPVTQTESDHCKHGTPRDPNWVCVQCGNEALRQSADADYDVIGTTVTQTESASENAELLRDLDSAAAGIQRLDRLDAEQIAKAIRALEAKVIEQAREIALLMDEKAAATYDIRADRDRLAGEARSNELAVISLTKALGDEQDTNARLTSELAAARENEARYVWLRTLAVGTGMKGGTIKWSLAFYAPDSDADEAFDAAIDAARSAGGET